MKILKKKLTNLRFVSFLQGKIDKNNNQIGHSCKFCERIFTKHTALGGHIAKNHPNLSVSYKSRKRSLKYRNVERLRNKFYKSLK